MKRLVIAGVSVISAAALLACAHAGDGTSVRAKSGAAKHAAGKSGAVKPVSAKASTSGDASDPVRIAAYPPSIETDADFSWLVDIHITNPDTMGLYLDSLKCEIKDLDPGETRFDRTTRVDLSQLVRLLHSIPAGDSTLLQHTGPATSERAELHYRLYSHRASGRASVAETIVEVEPGTSKEYASKFVDVDGGKAEYVIVPALGGTVHPAGLLMVHGHGNHARHMIRMARQLASRGFTVALVSMPGYGQSTGPAELMGPRSVEAASRVLDALTHEPNVDASRLAAWGISRGATVVAELATQRHELKAIVLQSGIYDLWATYRGTSLGGFRETIVTEAGTDSAAWRARSPLLDAGKIKAAVLVLHGDKDLQVPASQAHAFVAELQKQGAQVEPHFSPSSHLLAGTDVQRTALSFLDSHLK